MTRDSRVVPGAPWGLLECPGALSGASWGPQMAFWGPLGALGGGCWVPVGGLGRHSESLGCVLGLPRGSG